MTPLCDAVIVTVVFVVTAFEVIENATDDMPAGTVTVAGTLAAAGFELTRDTTAGPATGPWNFTALLVDVVPPTRDPG